MEGDTYTCVQYIYVCMYMPGKWVISLTPNVMKSVPEGRACNEYLEVQEGQKLHLFFYIGLFLPIRHSVSLHCLFYIFLVLPFTFRT